MKEYDEGMISIDLEEGRDALERLAHEWDAWVGDSQAHSVFARSAWYLAWLDAYPDHPVYVVTVRLAERLVGVLPLTRRRSDSRGLYFPRLSLLAAGPTDYQPPMIDSSLVKTVLPIVLDRIRTKFGSGSVQWWPNVPCNDPSYQVLKDYFSSTGMRFFEEKELAPRVSVAGNTYLNVERQWSSSHRQLVRRRRRQLADQGDVRLWSPSSSVDAEGALSEFFRVHDEKWLAQGYPGMFSDPKIQIFFRSMVRRMFGNGLHFSAVKCGEKSVSYHFGFRSGGWILWYRPTYRPEFAKFSPSKIHVSMLIENCCDLGLNGFDFLLGNEPYKADWATESVSVSSFHASSSRWNPGYFWFATAKPWARSRFSSKLLRFEATMQKVRNLTRSTPESKASEG